MKVAGTPEAFEVTRTCGGCQTRVIVEGDDLRIERTSRLTGKVIARCIVCSALMELGDASELPGELRSMVLRRRPA
jgi:hypothetical protein